MISAAVKTQKGESFNQPASELTHLPVFATTSVPLLQLPTSTSQPTLSQVNKRKVLFVTSELADLVKTGGLGDVSAALPRAMRHLHDVRVTEVRGRDERRAIVAAGDVRSACT